MSSIVYVLYDLEWVGEEIVAKKRILGIVEDIGKKNAEYVLINRDEKRQIVNEPPEALSDHASAFDAILERLKNESMPVVIGHRIVHGGNAFSAPVLVDDRVIQAIHEFASLAPQHNPPALLGLRTAIGAYPQVKHVACFDTAFHTNLAPEHFRYAIPTELYSTHNIRRYGFHGCGYACVTEKVTKRLFGGDDTGRGYIICYLGKFDASMSCVLDGQSLDTTMGLTPLEGLVMNTRCGDLDPGIITYLYRELGKSSQEIDDMLNTQCGLLALSNNVSSDMLTLQTLAKKKNPQARLARTVYVERIRKYLGSYLVKLHGKCDALIFTAHLGMYDADLRYDVCHGLDSLGIQLDDALNNAPLTDFTDIATTFSKTRIIVCASDEEAYIARQAAVVSGIFEREAELAKQAKIQANKLALLHRRNAQITNDLDDTQSIHFDLKLPALGRAVYIDGVGSTWREEVGLLFQILPHAPRLGYFRPFADDDDRKMRAMRDVFSIDHNESYNKARGASRQEAIQMLSKGREEELLDVVVDKFLNYSANKDFVLVSRASLGKHRQGDAFWTAKLAAALSLPVIYVTHEARSGGIFIKPLSSYLAQLSEVSNRVKQALEARGGKLAGIVTTLPSGGYSSDETVSTHEEENNEINRQDVLETCESIGVFPAAILEYNAQYSSTSIAEVADALAAAILIGESEQLAASQIRGVVVATRYVSEILEMLRQAPAGQLLVTHSERVDIILGVAMAQLSSDFPHLAGILVTGYHAAATTSPSNNFSRGVDNRTGRNRAMSFPPLSDTGPYDEEFDARSFYLRSDDDEDDVALKRALTILRRVPSTVQLPCIIAVADGTYSAVSAVTNITPPMLPNSREKIEAAQLVFEKYLNHDFRQALLMEVLASKNPQNNNILSPKPSITTPKLFQHDLYSRARNKLMTIVLPEADDRRILRAAAELIHRKLAKIILLGNKQHLRRLAKELRLESILFPTHHEKIIMTQVYDPQADEDPDEFRIVMANALYECRKHKGLTQDGALRLLRNDPNYYGTMLLQLGLADGMVSGACHSTAATMRPPLQIIKMKPGVPIVSSVFFMLLPHGVVLFGDCAINVNPTVDELAIIATASAQTARAFGIEPRVALLSYATGDSNSGTLIDKVRDATTKARDILPNEFFEGPIQFDAAVDPAVAKVKFKGKENSVAGKANVCIFPSLDSANAAYKAVQQASKCVAVGPIMQGMRKPVNDLSRGCTVNDIVNTVVVTAVQAQQAGILEDNN